jgi:two-component system nitrogen regulation sensor histidine kinase NtrY
VNRLRNRLILIFLAATLLPLGATLWITTSLLEQTLDFSTTGELEALSRTLEHTGLEFYQRERADLQEQAQAGKIEPHRYSPHDRHAWPPAVKTFADGDRPDRFLYSGNEGDRLDYLVRHGDEVWVYSASLRGVAMERLSREIRDARGLVDAVRERDLRRGFKLTYILLAAALWLVSLALLVYLAHRISRPIHQLTAGLTQLASGDLNARVEPQRDDEIGRAVQAFNHMASRLQESTERLVYLRQLASWQTLARKMAHELKNSLTPIRLTVEEMMARYEELSATTATLPGPRPLTPGPRDADRTFMAQATQIVVEEIESLERRIRAFSEFAAEPPVTAAPLDVNSLLEERIAFLKTAHPEVAYECRLAEDTPPVIADQDLLKGILTNLLENAAEAAGEGGRILGVTAQVDGRAAIEVHDSGPGLSEQVRASLFQPTISFKKKGMGLGLSIARKSALLSGGDIVVVKGELGGAGFRVLLPFATNGFQARPDRG